MSLHPDVYKPNTATRVMRTGREGASWRRNWPSSRQQLRKVSSLRRHFRMPAAALTPSHYLGYCKNSGQVLYAPLSFICEGGHSGMCDVPLTACTLCVWKWVIGYLTLASDKGQAKSKCTSFLVPHFHSPSWRTQSLHEPYSTLSKQDWSLWKVTSSLPLPFCVAPVHHSL